MLQLVSAISESGPGISGAVTLTKSNKFYKGVSFSISSMATLTTGGDKNRSQSLFDSKHFVKSDIAGTELFLFLIAKSIDGAVEFFIFFRFGRSHVFAGSCCGQ